MTWLERNFNYDTKEFTIDIFNKKKLISITEQREFDVVEEQIILKNIFENNGLIPTLYLIEQKNKEFIVLKNKNILTVLNKFVNNEISLTWMKGLNEKENPLYNDLKSSDKRRFFIFSFRIKLFYEVKDLTELVSLSTLI